SAATYYPSVSLMADSSPDKGSLLARNARPCNADGKLVQKTAISVYPPLIRSFNKYFRPFAAE
ncbi:MAG: hypothetical protein J6Q99_00665, partial [Oscillospiraceae bacterium]|nr:hypothetical protein [Oscillospiraceae bacterium]